VADLGVGLMIDTVRAISAADRYVRAGQWPKGSFPLATRFSGKRLGILGLGKIGRAIAQRAEGFQMQIRYHNRKPDPNCGYVCESSAESLARWCDFLMVAVSGGPHSQHLVNQTVLAALGPAGFLFNVSRGSVIDEQALVDALIKKTIAGAVPERLKAHTPVVLAPHIGSGTHETRAAMEALVLENLQSFFSTGKLLTPVI
jgi:lactate dehydrogenase-like 2-hydroxyacid dehydrogenase